MYTNIFAMWCFSIPVGLLAAFVWHLPVPVVYCIVNLDEIAKLPAVFIHYRKYTSIYLASEYNEGYSVKLYGFS